VNSSAITDESGRNGQHAMANIYPDSISYVKIDWAGNPTLGGTLLKLHTVRIRFS
jgi:hypothetical protein